MCSYLVSKLKGLLSEWASSTLTLFKTFAMLIFK